MRFTAAFVAAASIYLLPFVSAQDAEEPLPDVGDAAEVAEISRPRFTPTEITAPFLEQFTDDWESRWKISRAKKETKSDDEEWQYVGEWKVEEPTVYKGIDGDKGLVAKDPAAHHAISTKFPKSIDPKGKDLVVQYEVKLQDGLTCGGAYMKLSQDNPKLGSEEFSNTTPYVIMFGPDRCGSTNKVHFIFKHKNPKTGEYEEKHMDDSVSAITHKGLTTLYTLWVRPDQSFQVRVNGEAEKNGTLFEDFEPPVNPSSEIDDPNDKKPEDWVEAAKIPDPEATKPEDWDEEAPFQILDEAAEKPEDWLEDEPTMIPDPEASKPADWDDEEDGDWEPPMVPNPKCAEASGCGPWERPMTRNPAYKGKWTAPQIDNPEYKGVWAPAKIANPDYFEDKTPADFEPIGGLGFEIWTMQGDILFDNIYIGHSIEEADQLKKETFDIKYAVEERQAEAAREVTEDNPVAGAVTGTFLEDPVKYIQGKVNQFVDLVKEDPVNAVKTVPEVAGAIGIIIASLLALILGGGGAAAAQSPAVQDAAKKAKEQAVEAKDKAAEAISSGADKVQGEVNKRTTRSSGSAE